jgi:hypothetical protein
MKLISKVQNSKGEVEDSSGDSASSNKGHKSSSGDKNDEKRTSQNQKTGVTRDRTPTPPTDPANVHKSPSPCSAESGPDALKF